MKKYPANNKKSFSELCDLKLILNIWTFLTIFLFLADFFSGNQFDSAASAIGIIYLAILGIYAGEKEYDRWKTKFSSKFSGEIFILIWTIVMVVFVIIAPFSGGLYHLPQEFAIVYTSVIGVFAITQHSKNLHNNKL